MVSRRSVLGSLGAAAGVGVAGCSVLGGESGEPARFGRGATAPAESPVVARSQTEAGGRPWGRLASSSAVFELEDGTLVLASYHRVATGEAEYGSGWKYSGVRAEHAWKVQGSIVSAETNVSRVDADSPDARFELLTEATDDGRSWRVVLPEPWTNAVAYRFRTTFEPSAPPSDGDRIVASSGGAHVTDGSFFGGDEDLGTERVLVYGGASTDDE